MSYQASFRCSDHYTLKSVEKHGSKAVHEEKKKFGGFSDSGFKTRCPWHFGHSFASFDVSEKIKTDS